MTLIGRLTVDERGAGQPPLPGEIVGIRLCEPPEPPELPDPLELLESPDPPEPLPPPEPVDPRELLDPESSEP